jgi:hypothetical protein
MWRPASLALLALAVSATAQPAGPERYVPVSGWSGGQTSERLEDWWGGELRAMHEPVLSAPGAGTGFRRRFRLLLTRSRGMPQAIRIDERLDGGTNLRSVQLDNRDLSRARVAEDRSFALGRPERKRLFRAIRASGLRSAPREGLEKPDRPGEITVCVHPTTYVFELADAEGSRFVYRTECNISRRLKNLAEAVDELVVRGRATEATEG